MKLTFAILTMAAAMAAQDKPADPAVTQERALKGAALAQRDYLIAKSNLDAAVTKLQTAVKDASDACEKAGKVFNAETAACAEKPKAEKAK